MSEVGADAPGRVNLIGEHTDYQDGFVLPSAVPQRTSARLRPRSDRRVVARSAEMGPEPFVYEIGAETRRGMWGDYIQGLTHVLGAGALPGGFELDVRSDVPVGSGLSSSAALEVAVLRVMRASFGLKLSDLDVARVAQRAEVEFVGAPVGIMDQMAASLAGEREALFLDTRSLEYERIPLPSSLELVVIDSGIAHQHAGGDYVTRRRESEEAARLLRRRATARPRRGRAPARRRAAAGPGAASAPYRHRERTRPRRPRRARRRRPSRARRAVPRVAPIASRRLRGVDP